MVRTRQLVKKVAFLNQLIQHEGSPAGAFTRRVCRRSKSRPQRSRPHPRGGHSTVT
jgi:hypothetical protein